jgi:hypothetical protein
MLAADRDARPTMGQVVETLVELVNQDATPVRALAPLAAPGGEVLPPAPPQQETRPGPGAAEVTDDPRGSATKMPAVAVRRRRVSSRLGGRAAGPVIAVAALLSLAVLAMALLPVLSRGVTSVLREASRDQPQVYTTSAFALPFEVAAPTWLAPRPAVDQSALVTWQAPGSAVRFLVPVSVYPPGEDGPAPPPRDYLAYLLGQTGQGARFSDQSITSVGGRPAMIVTATAERRLYGAIGCPAAGMSPAACFGLRPERRLRLAVVDAGGTTLLIWLRNDRGAEFADQSHQFEQMLASVRFR